MTRTIVAQARDGSQILVTVYDYGSGADEVEVARREEVGDVWGVPLKIISDEVSS